MTADQQRIMDYLTFKTSRSGGKGGQHVNKVSSKVEVVLHIPSAAFLSDEEKALLMTRLAHRLDTNGNLHVIAQEDRSQLVNKETAVEKLLAILEKALKVDKPRKPTKIPRSVIRKRLENKHSTALKKEMRKRPRL
ncbi:aminoacyl-tRNA hydrolase [Pedobacter quisquiliarum]|jgi:ribosome-associated protein|uniref:Aminoacyl-tRNA hydrolase n=1 Tax=Pedobacter quisquiliarum TaxID=1834438 RepID=A0A916UDP3_9SPHI|nr:alternative ribosome rescue aminoacyl-tRNA hydrolase ArfB [Pedobacter quisquiliarum]GGC69915.1 aminoacyl-tRNA hydrolase [Pedobacter quisquiliarum]